MYDCTVTRTQVNLIGEPTHASHQYRRAPPLSDPRRGAHGAALTLVVAGQMAARAAPLRRARRPLGGVLRQLAGSIRRRRSHRALPAWAVRLQPRSDALVLARRLLRLRRERHRPL